jgi:hypothetical protein
MKPPKYSLPELVEIKKAFIDSGLAKWIVLAGIGGLVELARALVDIVRCIKAY